jgi:hypothetical protein
MIGTRHKKNLALLALSAAFAMPHVAAAEDSEKETPEEERKAKEAELNDFPQAVIDHIAYLEELEARYPDMGKVDIEALVEQEGEKAALLYCKAIGFDGPCTIDETKENASFEPVDPSSISSKGTALRWWGWLKASNFTAVGVIPETSYCWSVPYQPLPLISLHMDDEDRRNNNSRWGWIGATTSNRNTTWRFCKVNQYGLVGDFAPLGYASPDADYAVLKLGATCPSGARTITRYQDNEDWRNANWSSGNTYPNVNVNGRNWLTYYCHFDGGRGGVNGLMGTFPWMSFSYGVFGSQRMPSQYALAYGYVYQDDEDWFNMNNWSPTLIDTNVMGGGSNTWRRLVKVR